MYTQQNYGTIRQQSGEFVPMKEQDWGNLVLSELKRAAREYTTAALEATHPAVRQTFAGLAQKTMSDQAELYDLLAQMNGYGSIRTAQAHEVDQELRQMQQKTEELRSMVQRLAEAGQAGMSAYPQVFDPAYAQPFHGYTANPSFAPAQAVASQPPYGYYPSAGYGARTSETSHPSYGTGASHGYGMTGNPGHSQSYAQDDGRDSQLSYSMSQEPSAYTQTNAASFGYGTGHSYNPQGSAGSAYASSASGDSEFSSEITEASAKSSIAGTDSTHTGQRHEEAASSKVDQSQSQSFVSPSKPDSDYSVFSQTDESAKSGTSEQTRAYSASAASVRSGSSPYGHGAATRTYEAPSAKPSSASNSPANRSHSAKFM